MEKPSKLKPNPYFQSVVRFLLVYNTAEVSVFKMVVSLGIIWDFQFQKGGQSTQIEFRCRRRAVTFPAFVSRRVSPVTE